MKKKMRGVTVITLVAVALPLLAWVSYSAGRAGAMAQTPTAKMAARRLYANSVLIQIPIRREDGGIFPATWPSTGTVVCTLTQTDGVTKTWTHSPSHYRRHAIPSGADQNKVATFCLKAFGTKSGSIKITIDDGGGPVETGPIKVDFGDANPCVEPALPVPSK